MYRLIIADDEYWIRNNLRDIIDWEDIGIEIVGEAEDGAGALDLVKKLSPHIVITDIKMPGMNGIELIRQMKISGCNAKVVVLSGYDDYEYVREAMVSGAADYLLKPIKKIQLINILIDILESIDVDQQKEVNSEKTKEKLIRLANSIIEDTLSHILNGQVVYNTDLVQRLKYYGFEWNFKNYTVSIIKFVNVKDLINRSFKNDIESFRTTVRSDIGRLLKNEQFVSFFNTNSLDKLIMISNGSDRTGKQKQLEDVTLSFENRYNCVLKSGISGVLSTFEQLQEGYSQAKNCLHLQNFNNKSEVTVYSNKHQQSVSGNFDLETQKLLTYYLGTYNSREICKLLNSVIIKNIETRTISYEKVRNQIHELVFLIRSEIEALGINLQDKLFTDLYDAVECYDAGKLHAFLNRIIPEVCRQAEVERKNYHIKQAIEDIKEYIQSNYFIHLSLSSISSTFGIESTYLSKIFKQSAGINLTDYINTARIKKALGLMENSLDRDIKISEVSSVVGFSDYSYFNRVFKKYTGKSPKEYVKDISK